MSTELAQAAEAKSMASRFGSTLRRRRPQRRHVLPAILITLLVFWVAVGLFAPLLAPHDPIQVNLNDSAMPPAWSDGGTSRHLLGTDLLGRDLLSRVIYGARVSLTIAIAVITLGGGGGCSVLELVE